MVILKLKTPKEKKYSEFRDEICNSLKGNRGFIENDIIVSDWNQNKNIVTLILGDDIDKNPNKIEIDCDCVIL